LIRLQLCTAHETRFFCWRSCSNKRARILSLSETKKTGQCGCPVYGELPADIYNRRPLRLTFSRTADKTGFRRSRMSNSRIRRIKPSPLAANPASRLAHGGRQSQRCRIRRDLAQGRADRRPPTRFDRRARQGCQATLPPGRLPRPPRFPGLSSSLRLRRQTAGAGRFIRSPVSSMC
jgi:hypothetical protein